MSETRRQFSPEQKAQIVRRHLAGKETVSALADDSNLQPSWIHQWGNQLPDYAETAFECANGSRLADNAKDRHIAKPELHLYRLLKRFLHAASRRIDSRRLELFAREFFTSVFFPPNRSTW